ncbi:hypothetical protein BH09MYX1_BH09MYX1_16020 [soil metagenome]
MWELGPIWDDEVALAIRWRSATPFPHLVIDDFVPVHAHAELLALVDDESIEAYRADIFELDASRPEPRPHRFRALRDAFATLLAAPLARITGKVVERCDMRAYAYGAGHYLLPHSDHQAGVRRALAFAYYLPTAEPPIGGELELFACTFDEGQIASTTSAKLIEPQPNRLVVFDVGDVSLHQVREVLGGMRLSLSGWFYPPSEAR